MKTQELVDLLKEWKDEIVALTSQYNDAIGKLNEARRSFEKSWERRLLDWLKALSPVLVALIFIIFLWEFHASMKCGDEVSYKDFSLKKPCQVETLPSEASPSLHPNPLP